MRLKNVLIVIACIVVALIVLSRPSEAGNGLADFVQSLIVFFTTIAERF